MNSRKTWTICCPPRGTGVRCIERAYALGSLVFAAIVVLAAPASAQADNTPSAADDRPMAQPLDTVSSEHAWAEGVSEERQKRARALFVEANASLKQSLFLRAAIKYREALALWDHPGIHYNLALALISSLDDPLEVRRQLLAALRYGAAPLDPDKFRYAKNSLNQIEKQLAPIKIACNVQGAVVSLDNTVLFHAPGHYEGFVRPGDHSIRAFKLGFEPTEFQRTLMPGKVTKLDLKIYTEEQLVEKHTRWPFWVPVAVTGAGAALLGTGAIFLWQSNNKLKQFDQQIAVQCSNGCVPDPALADLRSTGKTYKTVATITLAAGAAVFTGGGVMMLINLPASHRITPEEFEQKLKLQPSLGLGYAGLIGTGHF
jgi:hypothetical protein